MYQFMVFENRLTPRAPDMAIATVKPTFGDLFVFTSNWHCPPVRHAGNASR
jgi:hypothetical protein